MFGNSIKKAGFTLPEVLVTLIIIGVVSALTVPGLKNHAEMQEYAVLAKKAFSTIASATKSAEMDHGQFKRWGLKDGDNDSIEKIYGYYKPYLSIVRECKTSETDKCWTKTKTLLNGETEGILGGNTLSFTLADGMNVKIDAWESGDVSLWGVKDLTGTALVFIVDVNGDKKPNQLGSDVFAFVQTASNGVIPAGASITDKSAAELCNAETDGYMCARRVIEEGKISY